MEYGLYVAHSQEPVFVGTAGECRAQVDLLTDEQKESGWTIGPLPVEPSPLPIDPDLWRRVVFLSLAAVGLGALLAWALFTKGCG